MPDELTRRYRATYLNDHLAAATAGVGLVDRATGHPGLGDPQERAALRREIREDLATLRELMARLGVEERRYKRALAWAAERVSRLKPNGRLLTSTALAPLVELEAMVIAVTGKRSGWLSLRTLAESDPRLDVARLDALVERADRQLVVLERMRRQAAGSAL